jgi:hypothetical protein
MASIVLSAQNELSPVLVGLVVWKGMRVCKQEGSMWVL